VNSETRLDRLIAIMRNFPKLLTIGACVVLTLGARPQATSTQSFAPSANQRFYLDLDTAEGAFSQWRHEDLKSLNALSATIRVPRLRKDSKWLPAFTIWLQDVGVDDQRHRIGVQLTAPNRKPPLEVRIIHVDKKELIGSEVLPIKIGLDEDLPVEMVWATPNSVTVKVGEQTRKINVAWVVESVGLSASTGQMKVDPLILGKTQD
jgi:hypothetical protein